MADSLKIPEALQMTFNRVIQRVPADKMDDIAVQESVLRFLKLGGERLARARLQTIIAPFPDDVSVVRPRPVSAPLESDDTDNQTDSDEEEED